MAKAITMLRIAAGPDFVLEQGKTYNLHDTLAGMLLAAPPDGTGPAARLATEDEKKKLVHPRKPDPESSKPDVPAESTEVDLSAETPKGKK